MPDSQRVWQLTHAERARTADLLEGLSPQQWSSRTLCGDWTVRVTAAHILDGAEQNQVGFFRAIARHGFRFNTMMDREAHRLGQLAPAEIIARLRARTSTTNHPPPPPAVMLGEVVVHGIDIQQPLGLPGTAAAPALIDCLKLYRAARFPVGLKKRASGLRLVATDLDWSIGDGPEVAGPAPALLLAITGRPAGLAGLTGDGLPVLRDRIGSRASLIEPG